MAHLLPVGGRNYDESGIIKKQDMSMLSGKSMFVDQEIPENEQGVKARN